VLKHARVYIVSLLPWDAICSSSTGQKI